MHNSDICNDRNKQGNQTPTNCASHVSSILLQTVDIILENWSAVYAIYLSSLKKTVNYVCKEQLWILKDLELADTGSGDDIELLIGPHFYWAFVTGNVRLGKVGEPVGVKIKFHLVFKWTPTKATECFDKS